MVTYRIPAGFLASRLLASALGQPARPFADDARVALRRYRGRVVVRGAEHLPARAPLLVVSNHYQRPGMGAEWTGIAVSALLAESIPGADIRWMHTDGRGGYRLFSRYQVPGPVAGVFMHWLSRRYGFLPVASSDVAVRAPMLRGAHRLLHEERRIVGIMPEGGNAGDDGSLGPAKPGAGASLAWLSSGCVPVVPAAVHESEDGALVVAFGEPFIPPRRRGTRAANDNPAAREQRPSALTGDATEQLMLRIAALLPPRLRGHYAAAEDAAR